MAHGAIGGGLATYSAEWSGVGKIYGYMKKTVSAITSPVRRRVDLYKKSEQGQTGRIIASAITRESDGHYEFLNLRIHGDPEVFEFMVVLSDWPPSSTVQESKIARWVRPEPM